MICLPLVMFGIVSTPLRTNQTRSIKSIIFQLEICYEMFVQSAIHNTLLLHSSLFHSVECDASMRFVIALVPEVQKFCGINFIHRCTQQWQNRRVMEVTKRFEHTVRTKFYSMRMGKVSFIFFACWRQKITQNRSYIRGFVLLSFCFFCVFPQCDDYIFKHIVHSVKLVYFISLLSLLWMLVFCAKWAQNLYEIEGASK